MSVREHFAPQVFAAEFGAGFLLGEHCCSLRPIYAQSKTVIQVGLPVDHLMPALSMLRKKQAACAVIYGGWRKKISRRSDWLRLRFH